MFDSIHNVNDFFSSHWLAESYPAKLTGTDLLGKRLGIEEHMLVFFGEHLKKIDSPWRDRRGPSSSS